MGASPRERREGVSVVTSRSNGLRWHIAGVALSMVVCGVGGCGHRFVYDPYDTGDGWRPSRGGASEPTRGTAAQRAVENTEDTEPVIVAVVLVKGPTIIGFFPPVTDFEVDTDPALSAALDRFTAALEDADACFGPRGVAVRAAFAAALVTEINGTERALPLGAHSRRIGFYLVAPEREPRRIDTPAGDGEHTPLLPAAAAEYFGVPPCPAGVEPPR